MDRAASAESYAGEGWREILAHGRWAPFLLICFGIWLHAADGLIVVTTIPAIVADIGGLAWTGWAFALYQVASIVAASLGGLAALRFGIGRATAGASAVFTIGCALDALAPDMGLFLIGRTVQGLGGGVMVALFHVAVTRVFPERHWTRIFAWVSAVWGMSALFGPLVGGLFAESGLWRGAYWAFAAQALLVTLCSPLLFSNVAPSAHGLELRVPWRALAMLVPGVLAIAVASVVGSTGMAALAVVVGAGFLACFFYFDRIEHSPLLPERSLSVAPVRFGLLMVLCFSVATISFSVYGPLLLVQLHHVSLLEAGYMIAIESVAWSVTAVIVGRVQLRGEPLCIKLGAGMIALGLLGFAISVPHGPIWAIALSAALQGGGFGTSWAFIARRVAACAIESERERAAGALPTTQMLSYAIGAALAAIIANSLGLTLATPEAKLQSIGFWIFFAFLPLTLPGFRAAWRLAR
jgi:MFS family permease